jgi:hypothetical protein
MGKSPQSSGMSRFLRGEIEMGHFENARFRQEFVMCVDLDERGCFKAHVANQKGVALFKQRISFTFS